MLSGPPFSLWYVQNAWAMCVVNIVFLQCGLIVLGYRRLILEGRHVLNGTVNFSVAIGGLETLIWLFAWWVSAKSFVSTVNTLHVEGSMPVPLLHVGVQVDVVFNWFLMLLLATRQFLGIAVQIGIYSRPLLHCPINAIIDLIQEVLGCGCAWLASLLLLLSYLEVRILVIDFLLHCSLETTRHHFLLMCWNLWVDVSWDHIVASESFNVLCWEHLLGFLLFGRKAGRLDAGLLLDVWVESVVETLVHVRWKSAVRVARLAHIVALVYWLRLQLQVLKLLILKLRLVGDALPVLDLL